MSNYLRLARDRATAADLYATVIERFLDDELQHWRKALLTRPTTSKLLEYAREKCSQRWVRNIFNQSQKYRLRYIMRRPTKFVSVATRAQAQAAQPFKQRSSLGLGGLHSTRMPLIIPI